MAQPSYIPGPDAGFNDWLNNFSTLLTATPADFGLLAGDATAVAAVVTPWNVSYPLAINPATRTGPAIAAKDADRTAAEQTVRPYAIRISQNPAVTNDNKLAIGVNLPNSARTPVPPPTTQPALSLVNSVHFQMQIAYRDTSTPTSKAKPPGAIGVELRMFIGTGAVPAPDLLTTYGTLTKSPATIGFTAPDVGKTCTYFARWVTRSGPGGVAQAGPWGAPLAVVVT
jgi:hypothetical protein